jgi:hypothetical protein
MDKSQMRVRPEFMLGLVVLALFVISVSLLMPEKGGKTRAKIILTRTEEREIASVLSQHASKIGGVTNVGGSWAFQALVSTSSFSSSDRTNTSGEILDFWDMPYRIELVGRTNFIIRSAGKNRKFGDADDIIFNSVSNDFVKP